MQETRNKKRTAAIAFAVLLCFVVFSACTVAFLAGHAGHDCVGAHCATCQQLRGAAAGLKLLAGAGSAGPAGPVMAAAAAAMLLLCTAGVLCAATPVTQKVQMND